MLRRLFYVIIYITSGLTNAYADEENILNKPNKHSSLNGYKQSRLLGNDIGLFLDPLIKSAQSNFHIPGVTVSIVQNGEMLFSRGYGYADEKNKVLVDPDTTQFPVASVSKLFTFTAIMQLVEKGDLSLDDHVADILEFDEINHQYTPITIRQLMNHSAGFEESFLGSSLSSDSTQDEPLLEYIRKFRQERVRENGKYIVYSNYGVILAGAIIEKVKAMPFERYMQNKILSPLNMKQSIFESSTASKEHSLTQAIGHYWNGINYNENRKYFIRHGMLPTAGLKTTANDMAKYMIFHLENGENIKSEVLSFESIKKMHSELKRNHPALDSVNYGFWSNKMSGYKSLEHEGVSNGFVSKLSMIPELNLGVFISTNSSSGYQLTNMFTQNIINHFFTSKKVNSKIKNNIDLSKYEGNYLMLWGNSSGIEKLTSMSTKVKIQNSCLAVWIGFEQGQWCPIGDQVFVNSSNGERIAFKVDDNDDALMLSHDMVFKKIGLFENSRFFLLVCVLATILSIIILLINLIYRIKNTESSIKEKIFLRVLGLTATLWSGFIGSLFYTLISASTSFISHVHAVFPDPSTVIGQWIIIGVLCCIVYLIAKIKNYWMQRKDRKFVKIFQSIYIFFLALLVIWSLEFNLIGFQY